METKFVAMTEEYVKRAAEIYNYYVINTTATFTTEAVTPEEMKKILYLGVEPYECYAILEEGKLAGYVCFESYRTRCAYNKTAELTLYLDQRFIGKGIGKKAIGFIENRAKQKGMICLIAVITGENTRSCRLFSSCGYEKCGHIKDAGVKFGRRLDVVFYQKITDHLSTAE